MKFFRIDLLTLLISLFILNSCKNQDTAGFTLGTKGNLTGSLVDTATVFTKTVAEDSVVTSALTKCPLGYFNDPIFGTTQSDLITDLNLPGSAAYTLPAGTITIDSAVLLLKYASGFYGDSTASSKYVLNVYQLAQRQADGATYYNFSVFNHQSTVLGTKSFTPRPNTKVVIDSAVTGKAPIPDTVAPQIRIPISQSFIRTSLFGASATQLASNLIFKNNVKGLYVTIDKTQSTGVGGTMMFNPPDSLAVYIRAASGTVIDTEIVVLPITQHASYINHVRSATVQNAINNKTTLTDSVVYLQGLAGSRVKVSFPYIDSLFSHRNVGGVNNIVINRAELVVSVNNIKNTDIPAYLVPLPRLTMYELDIAHQRVYIPDASGLSNADAVFAFGGYYLASVKPANTYHFLVTSYLQNLITNKLTDYGTYIAPTDTASASTVSITPSAIMAARTVAGGGYVNSPGAKNSIYSMRLNVIYTKTK